MTNAELLKSGRDMLLKLHKEFVDFERSTYTAFNGPVSPTEFLHQLIENPDLSWLRKFSILIVDIDEMFAQRDGYNQEAVDAHIVSMRRLVNFEFDDAEFQQRYELALQTSAEAVTLHSSVKKLLSDA